MMRTTSTRRRSVQWRAGRRARRSASVLVLLALLAACSGDDSSAPSVTEQITQLTAASTSTAAPAVRIMPLGDSLTEGGDPSQPMTSAQSYRGYLYHLLVDAGYDVDFVGSAQKEAVSGGDPDHEGHGGYTIGPDGSTLCTGCGPANLDAGLDGWLAQNPADIILLLAGVNDLLPQSEPATGLVRNAVPQKAGDHLKALVERIRTLAPDTTVVVASYPPVSYLVDPSLGKVDAFNGLNSAARQLGEGGDAQVLYAPMFETFEDSWTNEDVLGTADQLHPSATGANRIAKVWFDVLAPVLDARRGG
jgi:lysophospholipase L1-like esterase